MEIFIPGILAAPLVGILSGVAWFFLNRPKEA